MGGTAAYPMSKGTVMRKVRASQGRITDNVRRRRLPGKCNRNSLPKSAYAERYRWKGEVKAHRHGRQLRANVNPIRCNTASRILFARHSAGGFRHIVICVADRWQSRDTAYRTRLTSPLNNLIKKPDGTHCFLRLAASGFLFSPQTYPS